MSNHRDLQTIDPAALARVSGGATSTATNDSDQILTALTGILSSIQSIASQPRSTGGFNAQEMFMLMMIMQQRSQQQAVAASSGAWAEPIVRYY